jgi:outer membrane lipoprotein-sorting protein
MALVVATASALAMVWPAVAAAGTPDGLSVLTQAVAADDRVSFSGTITSVVYGDSANATVVRIDHLAPHSWRLWFVAPADAYGRLILSNESVAYQYEPKTGKVFSNAWGLLAPGIDAALDLGRVSQNYSIQVGAQTSVAGHKALTLSLVSNYTDSLVQRLWVDEVTKIVLQREAYHADGTIASKTSFDNIKYVKSLPADLFSLSVPAGMTLVPGAVYGKSTTDVAALAGSVKFKVAAPKSLPNGFALQKGSSETREGVETVQLIYSDGLRTFSLFENSTARLPKFEGAAPKTISIGGLSGEYALVSGQSLVSWNSGKLNLTMVGDVGPKELARIGSAIKL